MHHMPRITLLRLACLAPALAFCLLATGCVERTISITSQPSGALVRLNDQAVGRTPVNVPFKFYGTYDVRLSKNGYQSLWTKKATNQPFWEYPGPDLFAEAVPNVHVTEHWHFTLKKATPPNQVNAHRLLDRARQMRALIQPGGSNGSHQSHQ